MSINGQHTKYIGEITGDNIDTMYNEYDKGMPVRSTFNMKDTIQDNKHLDFNLFDKIENTQEISYSFDTGNYAELDNVMKPITLTIDPFETCITDMNVTTLWMHSNMYQITQKEFIVNGNGLFTLFGVIYLTSTETLSIELKNYFGFQEKQYLNAGLITIKEELDKHRTQLIFDYYLINDNTIKIQPKEQLKKLVHIITINKTEKEIERVNYIFKTKSKMDTLISKNTLLRTQISLISVANIKPIWKYKIDSVDNNNICFIGKTFNYYEDSQSQFVEVPLYNIPYVLGFIKNKHMRSVTDLKIITTAINYMKPTILNMVRIPIIKKRYKTRFNKTLKQSGLTYIFLHNKQSTLYNNWIFTDYLQYIDLEFSLLSGNVNCDNKGHTTTRKFICNTNYEIYLRHVDNNYIMLTYCL